MTYLRSPFRAPTNSLPFVFVVLVLLHSSGCSQSTGIETSDQLNDPKLPFTLTPSNLPSILSTPEEPKTVITLNHSLRSCPEIQRGVPLPNPSHFEDILRAIGEYLNAGGDPREVELLFNETEDSGLYVLVFDFDLDDNDEVVIAGPYFSPMNADASATLIIFQCTDGKYSQAYSRYVDEISYGYFLDDFDFPPLPGDDLVFVSKSLHGHRVNYLVIAWDGSEFATLLEDAATSISFIVVFDRNTDGIPEVDLIVPTESSSSAESIYDEVIRYEWSTGKYERVRTDILPSSPRVELLEEAQLALSSNDPAWAVGLYRVAAEDINPYSTPSEYEISMDLVGLAEPYQRSFAAFRNAVLLYNLGCIPCAEQTITHIESWFPKGKPGGEFLEAYDQFLSEMNRGSSLDYSCDSAEEFLSEKYPNVAGENGHLGNWGLDGFDFGIDGICPEFHMD